MEHYNFATHWEKFQKENPDAAEEIAEIAIRVCSHSNGAQAALESEDFQKLCRLVYEHHDALGLSGEMNRVKVLEWTTREVFSHIFASEKRG